MMKKISGNKVDRQKIFNFLMLSFLILFIIFPLLPVFEKTKYLLPSTVILFLLFLFVNWKNIKIFDNKKTIWVIIIGGFLIRLISAIVLSSRIVQVSDFMEIFNNAESFSFPTFYFQTAYHYFYYTLINAGLFKIFGAHQIVSIIFNVVISLLVSIFLYKIMMKITSDRKISNLAALLYVIWPSMIFYNVILSPDHVATLFMAIAIYFLVVMFEKMQEKEPNIKHLTIFSLLSGISISLIGFFKNFSPVLLIVVAIVFILLVILKKYILKWSIYAVGIVFISYFLCNAGLFAICENVIGGKVLKNQVWQYAYVGLGLENEGCYSQKRYGEFHQFLIDNNMDIKAANKYFSEKLLSEIKENYASYPELLKLKTERSFADDGAQFDWIQLSITEKNADSQASLTLINLIREKNQYFYILIILFVLVGCLYNILGDKNIYIFIVNLTVYGCCLLLLLAESQGRYKYAFEPLLCLLAAYGLYNGKSLLQKHLSLERRRK